MSGGIHIKFRTGPDAIEPDDEPIMGEPRWDPERSRLGVFNNIGARYEWQMSVVDKLHFLNPNERLSGKTTADEFNNVEIDWDTPNELRIRNSLTNQTLARFTDSGVFLHSPTLASEAEMGISNRILNGNLVAKFNAVPLTFPRSTTGVSASEAIMPNWLLWKSNGSSGNLAVEFDETDVPSLDIPRSFLCTTTGAPNALGLRSFIHTYDSLRGRRITMYASYKGIAGEQCTLRVVNSLGEIDRRTFTFNGIWQDEELSVQVPDEDGEWLGFDFIFAPHANNPATLTFRAAKFGVSIGATAPRYESRSIDMEKALLRGIFTEGSTFTTASAAVGIPLGLCDVPDIGAYSPAGSVSVTDLTALGAAATVLAGGSGVKRIDYRAAVVKRTAETT